MYTQERMPTGHIDAGAPKERMPQVAAACIALEETVATGEKLMQELEKHLSPVLRTESNASGAGVLKDSVPPPVGLAQRLNETAERARMLNDRIKSIAMRLEL